MINFQQVAQSTQLVQEWVERHDYKGYEPFDGLSSWARPFMLGNLFAERLLMQAIRQSPWNLRPLLGVRPKDSTKGRGYMAAGYLVLYRVFQQQEYLDKATACLEWLDKHKVQRFQFHSWSNHFDFVSRGGRYTSDDPIIVWTALIGHAYLDAFEITGREWFLDIAISVSNWIMQLPREKTPAGECISYLAHVQSSIHNSSMLGAGFLARTALHTRNENYLAVARSAMQYSCSRQLSDGAWWYGEDPMYHWVDNFHTGYNLESLRLYIDSSGEDGFRTYLDRGLAYYKANFFEESGRPKYYNTRPYPIDMQCAAQSVETLANSASRDPECLQLAKKVAAWTIDNMQDSDGHFYYRQYPMIKAKTPMLHWGQATMFKALACLQLAMKEAESSLSLTESPMATYRPTL